MIKPKRERYRGKEFPNSLFYINTILRCLWNKQWIPEKEFVGVDKDKIKYYLKKMVESGRLRVKRSKTGKGS